MRFAECDPQFGPAVALDDDDVRFKAARRAGGSPGGAILPVGQVEAPVDGHAVAASASTCLRAAGGVAVVMTEGMSLVNRVSVRSASFLGAFLFLWMAGGRQPATTRVAPSQLPPIASVLAPMLVAALAREPFP